MIVHERNQVVIALNDCARHQQPLGTLLYRLFASLFVRESTYVMENLRGLSLRYRWENFVLRVTVGNDQPHEIDLFSSAEKILSFWKVLVEKKLDLHETDSTEFASQILPGQQRHGNLDHGQIIHGQIIFEKPKTSPSVRLFWQATIGGCAILSSIIVITSMFSIHRKQGPFSLAVPSSCSY